MLLETPQSTANETCTLELGWETIGTHLDIRLLRYRNRISTIEDNAILRG